jgi:hypothetical protein
MSKILAAVCLSMVCFVSFASTQTSEEQQVRKAVEDNFAAILDKSDATLTVNTQTTTCESETQVRSGTKLKRSRPLSARTGQSRITNNQT